MSSREDSKNTAPHETIAELDELCKSLKQNVILTKLEKLHLQSAVDEKNTEAVKFLIQNSASVDREGINYIFKLSDSHDFKALVFYIINHYKDVKIMQMIYEELIASKYEGATSVEILELLIDQGLGVNDFIDGLDLTPLHMAVKNKRVDLVSKTF